MKRPVWAIVPAKSLVRGKSRLRPLLDDEGRANLAQRLLEHVLDVLRACELDGVLVATDGDDVAALAQARGFAVLRDRGEGTLAQVVDRALSEATSRGGASAIVLMADLPLVEPEDVRSLLALLDDNDLALVRDHLGHHTNAMALELPAAVATCFGRDESFAAHFDAGRAAGLRVSVVDSERMAFDVDLPSDHDLLKARRPAAET